MSKEQVKRLKGGLLILAFCALVFGVPSAFLSGDLLDIVVLSAIFGLPSCYLTGVFDPHVWGFNHDRAKEHS